MRLPALWVAAVIMLSGCAEEPAVDQQDVPEEPDPDLTPPSPEPEEPTLVRELYQEEHATMLTAAPASCQGLPPASGFGPNGIDAYGFQLEPDSEGLEYNFTAGDTGQELLDYVIAFLSEDFESVLDTPSAAPGETITGTIPQDAFHVFIIHCAGGAGKADFESYRLVPEA